MFGAFGIAYSIWLMATGSPIFYMRARPISTRPVVLYDNWFRYAGAAYLIGFFLVPELGGFGVVLRYALPAICYVIGLWRSLSPKLK